MQSTSTWNSGLFDGMPTNKSPQVGAIKEAALMAVRSGRLTEVKMLVQLVTELVLPVDNVQGDGQSFMDSLLASAIRHGGCDIVEILIVNGANPNSTYQNRYHLTRAILEGRADVFTCLLAHGADARLREFTGKTPLHVAASCADEKTITTLLTGDCDLEARDRIQGNTAMHLACSFCNRGTVMALLKYGAEFNVVNHQGDTPLSKLLKAITKADDFHNWSRLTLAKELVQLGFILPALQKDHTRVNHHRKSFRNTKSKQRTKKSGMISGGEDNLCKVYPSRADKMHDLYVSLTKSFTYLLSLRQLCRLCILRGVNTRPLKSSVEQLGLPKLIREYVISGDNLSVVSKL